MGKTRMYNREWNGISLTDIAKKLNKTEAEVAASDFYGCFYQEMKDNGWSFDDDWMREKRMLGRAVLDISDPSIDDRIISLGAGTGICEIEALEGGYNIELQEVQSDSLDYLETVGAEPARVWVTDDISVLPSETYDLAILNHIMYCFDDNEYIDFVSEVNRILRHGARAIITAENISEMDCIRGNLARNRFLRRVLGKNEPRVFWGYLRTSPYHKKLLSRILEVKKSGNWMREGLNYSYYLCEKRE